MKQQEDRSTELNAGMGYNALIDSVGINVCKLLLDDELTILWGNDNFYISSPVLPKQNIRRCFPVSKHIMQGTGKSFIKSKMHLPPPQKKLDAGPRSIAVGRLKMLAVPGSISTL